ncbi:hypothetical protein AB0J86_19005 [Micromonospora sp. NPDC049559]|uniref:hypothetical protein n=1 Tax=Micromonospora sp. NPDC049559 TaxID=3155923 RepID=UPI003446AF71
MVSRVKLRAEVDDRLGGRWTSLRGGRREWLWSRPDPARAGAVPGDGFVDAGGLEECLPTVRGTPDHGDVWSRPWRRTGDGESTVAGDDFALRRRIAHHDGAVTADYLLRARPGYRFVWAAHALLDLSPRARLLAPDGTPTRLYPDVLPQAAGPGTAGAGPAPAEPEARPTGPEPWVTGAWPDPAGIPLDRFGPDDGSAVGAVLLDCPEVRVADGLDTLTLRLDCPGQPRSTALWRNLGGWPAGTPYRSTGVEPMLGAVFDLATAGPDDAAVVPPTGVLGWRLTISAHRTTGGDHP